MATDETDTKPEPSCFQCRDVDHRKDQHSTLGGVNVPAADLGATPLSTSAQPTIVHWGRAAGQLSRPSTAET